VPFDGGYRAWRQAVADGWTVAAEAARRANRSHGAGVPSTGRRAALPKGAAAAGVAVAEPAVAPVRATVKGRPKLSKDAYRRRRETLDGELGRLGLRKTQLELAMGMPSVTSNFVEMRRVTSELADIERALGEAEDAWLELEEQAP
jgi:hypothetical protein